MLCDICGGIDGRHEDWCPDEGYRFPPDDEETGDD